MGMDTQKVETECLHCGHRDQLAMRAQGGMVVRRCSKCKTMDQLFTQGAYGVITDNPASIKKIKVALSERDTQSWRHLVDLEEKIRAKMANGTRSELMCAFCDDEPHNRHRECQCFCHPIKVFIQRVKDPGDGELERRVA